MEIFRGWVGAPVEVNTVLFGGFLGSTYFLFILFCIGGNILRLGWRPCGGQHCSIWQIPWLCNLIVFLTLYRWKIFHCWVGFLVEVNTVIFGGFLGSIFCLYFLPYKGGNIPRLGRRPCGWRSTLFLLSDFLGSMFCLFFILLCTGGNIPRLGRRPCGGQHCSIWRIPWLYIFLFFILP